MTTNVSVIHDLQIRFQFRTLTCDSDWTIFSYEKENRVMYYEVQVKENYRQSGHKRVWDMVLSIIGRSILIEVCLVALGLGYRNRFEKI